MEFPTPINWTRPFHSFVGLYFSFLFNFLKKLLYATSGQPDRAPHFAASDLVLHCLSMSQKKDAMLIWVKCHNLSVSQDITHMLRYVFALDGTLTKTVHILILSDTRGEWGYVTSYL